MKKIIFGFVFLFVSTLVFSQNLKVLTPKVKAWDISEKGQKEFVEAGKLIGKENLTADEKKLLNKFDDVEVKESFFTTQPETCSWYCGGAVDTAYSSSTLKGYKKITYNAWNIHDFDASTAWVEGVKGYGIGEKISLEFPLSSIDPTILKIYNGYMKSVKAWKENSRVRTLKLYINGNPYALLQLEDVIGQQVFIIDSISKSKTTKLNLTFEIYDVYKGTKYDETAISEINFDGLGVHCFAAGTLIKMADGSEKPIETIAEGDEVLMYNFDLSKTQKTTVSSTAKAQHHNLVQIDFGDKQITVTDDHPFYVTGKGWCTINGLANSVTSYLGEIKKLEVGDNLLTSDGKSIKLNTIAQLNICKATYTITQLSEGNNFIANGLVAAVE